MATGARQKHRTVGHKVVDVFAPWKPPVFHRLFIEAAALKPGMCRERCAACGKLLADRSNATHAAQIDRSGKQLPELPDMCVRIFEAGQQCAAFKVDQLRGRGTRREKIALGAHRGHLAISDGDRFCTVAVADGQDCSVIKDGVEGFHPRAPVVANSSRCSQTVSMDFLTMARASCAMSMGMFSGGRKRMQLL